MPNKSNVQYALWEDIPKELKDSHKIAEPTQKVWVDPQTGRALNRAELVNYNIPSNVSRYIYNKPQVQYQGRHGSDNVVDAQRGAAYDPRYERAFYGTSDYDSLLGKSRVNAVQQAWEHNPEAMQLWSDAGDEVGGVASMFVPVGGPIGEMISAIKPASFITRGLNSPLGRVIAKNYMEMSAPRLALATTRGTITPITTVARPLPQHALGLLGLTALGAGLVANNASKKYYMTDDEAGTTESPISEVGDTAVVINPTASNDSTHIRQSPSVSEQDNEQDNEQPTEDKKGWLGRLRRRINQQKNPQQKPQNNKDPNEKTGVLQYIKKHPIKSAICGGVGLETVGAVTGINDIRTTVLVPKGIAQIVANISGYTTRGQIPMGYRAPDDSTYIKIPAQSTQVAQPTQTTNPTDTLLSPIISGTDTINTKDFQTTVGF